MKINEIRITTGVSSTLFYFVLQPFYFALQPFQFRLKANVILKTEVLALGFLSVLSLYQERGHPSPTLYIKVYIII